MMKKMKVGRIVRLLTDDKRLDYLSNNKENRRLIISIFYPTDEEISKSEPAFYKDLFYPCEEEFVKRWAERKNISGDVVNSDYLRSIVISTYDNIPISKNKLSYPVIIYSPGLGMDRDSSVYIIEKLASAGYVVITLGHTYETDFTVMPNGEIIEQAKKASDSTIECKNKLIDIRKQDILFLLDELNTLNNEKTFINGKLDLDKIGIMGHSLGGAAVFNAVCEDSRFKAVVMLDGSLQYLNLKKDISEGKRLYTPFLNFRRGSIGYFEEMKKAIEFNIDKTSGDEFKNRIIMRHQTLMGQIDGQKQLYEYLAEYKSFIKLINSEHLTFTDWSVLFNKDMENGVLSIKKAHEIISNITIKFYNEFLYGMYGEYSGYIDSPCCYEDICKINYGI